MHGIMGNDYMFSGKGVVPWHGIGAVLDGVLTSDRAINEAHLTWIVEQTPVYATNNWVEPTPGFPPMSEAIPMKF